MSQTVNGIGRDAGPSGTAIVARDFGWRHASRIDPTFSGVNFSIEPGEKVLVLGESGAGKSTLLSAIAGVLGGDDDGAMRGTLSVDGVDPRAHKGLVGLVLQDPDSQVIASRVGDDVVFGCENLDFDRETMWRRARWALALVGLDVPLGYDTAKLSGGQKQRLALAGVLAMGAKVIALDEPTANLDPAGVAQVKKACIDAADLTGATLLVVEHRVDIWADDLDRALVVGAGGQGIVADGPIDEVIATKGQELADQGVWMPGFDPVFTPAKAIPATTVPWEESALFAENLQCGWDEDHPVSQPHTVGFRKGASTVITGLNGCGKSTLALTIAGLLQPIFGAVIADDSVARGLNPDPHEWSSRELSQRIGYVFQDPEHQFVARTVREELALGPKLITGGKRSLFDRLAGKHATGVLDDAAKARIDDLLVRLKLDHLAEANPFTLSGGQKRRLSVATALACAPSVVIFDEPTFGQDRTTFLELIALIRQLTDDGITVISITHDELFIEALGDYRYDFAALHTKQRQYCKVNHHDENPVANHEEHRVNHEEPPVRCQP